MPTEQPAFTTEELKEMKIGLLLSQGKFLSDYPAELRESDEEIKGCMANIGSALHKISTAVEE